MRQRNKGQLDCSMMMLNNTGQSTVVFLFLISQLYRSLASLEVPQPCTTCQQALPEITLIPSQSQECKRCSKASYYSTMYSCDNDMDPGPIPSELQVCSEL